MSQRNDTTRNRLRHHSCYLAGSIDQSAQDNYGKQWREDITPFLHNLDIGVFNPCDKPVYNTKVQEDDKFVEHINELKKLGRLAQAQREMQEIVRIDLKLVDLSNFLILNIAPDKHMCGSYAEQTLACFQRKPIIVHCAAGIHKVPNWLFGICDPELFFSDWPAVREYITDIAIGETVDDNDSKWRFLDYDKVFGRNQIHPCNCTSYNGDQCYNCLNGAHELCKDCKNYNDKVLGLPIQVENK